MKQIITSILISAFITSFGVYGFYNWLPFAAIEPLKTNDEMLGVALTTIAGTDTLKDSRTTINDNFTLLNDNKIESSTTTIPTVTTLANLVTVGTLTSGTWNGSTLGVDYGGTGSTTFQKYAVLLGSSTSAMFAVDTLGTSGQFLTSNGASEPPSWSTSSVSLTDTYDWTGGHTWTASSTHNLLTVVTATSTNLILQVASGADKVKLTATTTQSGHGAFTLPIIDGTANQILATDGIGNLGFATSTAKYFSTVVVNDASAGTTYNDLDLSAYTNGGQAVVYLKVCDTDAGSDGNISFRPNGDADTYSQAGGSAATAMLGTGTNCAIVTLTTDAAGIVEWDSSVNNLETTITLLSARN